MTPNFIPCTINRHIGHNIYFRPIKSWHSGTFAGEGLTKIPGTDDGSGCLKLLEYPYNCSKPLTVTHRIYWMEPITSKNISAFLSYPSGMGAIDDYFWEAYGLDDDIVRYTGYEAELEMEQAIIKFFLEAKP